MKEKIDKAKLQYISWSNELKAYYSSLTKSHFCSSVDCTISFANNYYAVITATDVRQERLSL